MFENDFGRGMWVVNINLVVFRVHMAFKTLKLGERA